MSQALRNGKSEAILKEYSLRDNESTAISKGSETDSDGRGIPAKPIPEVSEKKPKKKKAKKSKPTNPRIQALIKKLSKLNLEERKQTFTCTKKEFDILVKQHITCVGCYARLETVFSESLQHGHQDPDDQSGDGILIEKDKISVRESVLSSTEQLSRLVDKYSNLEEISDLMEELGQPLSGNRTKRSKLAQRCVLHSKKPIPVHLWKNAITQLQDNEFRHADEAREIPEKEFLANLETHFKKRKFCNSCKDNVMSAYEEMRETQNFLLDEEDEIDDEDDDQNSSVGSTETEGTLYERGFTHHSDSNICINDDDDEEGIDVHSTRFDDVTFDKSKLDQIKEEYESGDQQISRREVVEHKNGEDEEEGW
mmetsp:Transcript_5980/g.6678  ORF Transcript_5980/g.6678 Transcript_5980/m.6678 type:complete len:367 (-) Transcript_5980:88-1188(-)